MELVSSNHHILEKIFVSSKTSALLNFRLVCKQWAEETARILRKRRIIMTFRSVEDIEEFLGICRPTSTTFSNFTVDIPSTHPMRDDAWQEMHPIIVDLLECYRESIKELKFWYQPLTDSENSDLAEEEITNREGLVDLSDSSGLATHFDCLTSLQLLSNYVQSTSGIQHESILHRIPKYFERLSTPNLHSLTIQYLHDTECSSIVSNIIRSSRDHLEYLKIPAKPFPAVALDQSFSLENLRELDLLGIFHGFSCSTNETLDCIIKACPRLQKLGIEFSFRTNLPKIQEMLNVLSATLEELRCTIQDRNLLARQITRVDFMFPEMAKLQSLQMRWSNPGFVYYIDRLPVLKELLLDTVWTRKIQGSIYPSGQIFQEGVSDYKQLSNLKLTEILSVEQITAFSQYFPNLKVLGCSFDSDECLRVVYKSMCKLKCLIIERKSNITEAGGICGLIEGQPFCDITDDVHQDSTSSAGPLLPNLSYMKELESLEMCQLGATWQSLRYGVVKLTNLKTLVIQSTVFRTPVLNQSKNCGKSASLQIVGTNMKQLRKLKLWIRHSSEKPSTEELTCMEKVLGFLHELSIVNHSLCGI